MKILVLGGTRFIGRAIVDALLAEHDVTVLNRGTTPLWDRRIGQVTAGRNDPSRMAAAVTEEYEAVVGVSALEPEHVKNVIDLPVITDGVRYVFIGSAAVSDSTLADPPFDESDPDHGDPLWGHYGAAKSACEKLLEGSVSDGLVILRPPYVYDPHNDIAREQFLWARMLTGRPVYVPGSGGTRIQFCHVGLLSACVVAACEGRLAPGTYNVGENRAYTFLEYLAVLGRVARADPRPVHVTDSGVGAREYFPFRDADLSLKVDRILAAGVGESPDLETGLAETYRWFRDEDLIRDEPTERERQWRAGTHHEGIRADR